MSSLADRATSNGDGQSYKTFHCRFTKELLIEGNDYSKPLLESHCYFQRLESDTDTDKFIGNDFKLADILDLQNERESVVIGASVDCNSKSLESMLMTMKRGEISRFHVWRTPLSSTTHNTASSPNDEKACDSLESEDNFLLVLHDFTDVAPIWQLNSEQKYDLAFQHKDNGTSFFKEDKVESAFYQYSLALKYVISSATNSELDDSQREKYKQLRCVCYLNLAACQIKSENFESVIDNCTKGLLLDGWNVKGLYRRALAYKNVGKFDEARSDLIKIVKKQPRNKTAADLLESLMPSNIENDDDTS